MIPDSVVGAIVTSVLFSVYLPTAYPSVPGGDSGELLAEACTLGVAHPPGYPLFIYFARACMEIMPPALGPPAYRVNLGCCGLGALAGGMLHCAMVSLARSSGGGGGPLKGSSTTKPPLEWWLLHQVVCASVAILWGLSPLIWLYHIGAEVFAMSNFFVVSLLLGGVKFGEAMEGTAPSFSSSTTTTTTPTAPAGSRVRHLMHCAHALSFLCGLALCNQHTALLLVVPLGAWVAFTLWPILPYPIKGGSSDSSSALALQRMATLFLAGVAGLLPYLHLPLAHTLWRSAGSWGDTTTLTGLVRHFLRSDYGTFRLVSRDGPAEGPWERTGMYVRDLVTLQLPHVAWGVPLVVGVGYAALGGVLYPFSSLSAGVGVKKEGVGIKAGGEAVEEALAVARHRTASLSITALLLFPLIFYFAVFHGLSNMPLTDPLLFAVHARFWLHPNALAFPLAAMGVLCFHRTLLLLLLPLLSSTSSLNTTTTTTATTTTSGGNAADGTSATSPPPSALPLGWRVASLLLTATLGTLSVTSVALQRTRNTSSLDNSRNTAIGDYGRALLAPLPPNSTLLTAYDFQWTASRYLQSCEGFRRDVAILNAPVMSYPWFSAQRHLYPSLTFPGTHLTPFLTAPHAAGGFSFADLCAVNLGGGGKTKKKKKEEEEEGGGGGCGASLLLDSYTSDPPHTTFKPRRVVCSPQSGGGSGGGGGGGGGGIFYAGSVLGSGGGGGGGASATTESAFTSTFTSIPFGILTRVLPPKAPITTWRAMHHHTPTSSTTPPTSPPTPTTPVTLAHIQASRAAWATAVTHYYAHGPVNSTQFDDTTWEQATRLDFWFQASAHATWLLEWATSSSPDVTGSGITTAMEVVAEAACLLEATLHAASEHAKPPTSPDPNTLKNLGLAYVHMVRAPSPLLPPPSSPSSVVAPGDAARLPVLPAIRAQAALSSPTTHNASTAAAMVASLSQPPTFCLPPGMVSEELWRLKAAERVLETWGAYLATPQARGDPGTPQIKSVVQVLREAAGGRSSGGGGGGSSGGATGATPPTTGKANPKGAGGVKKGK